MNSKETHDLNNAVQRRKFGLPDWMFNNIERLNFVTDFEQYACSPPETEGFLADYKESHESVHISEAYCPLIEPKTSNNSSSLHNSLLDSLKNEEMFSSPDSTPCSTPQPSPVVRRKMSNSSDTVITNPGRWFYLGKMSKLQYDLKKHSLVAKNEENETKMEDQCSINAVKPKKHILESKNNGIKLMISNFDLNAVSPTSW